VQRVIELLDNPETRAPVLAAVQEQISQVTAFVQKQDDSKLDEKKEGAKHDILVTDTRCQP
jgi:hypothetical protein